MRYVPWDVRVVFSNFKWQDKDEEKKKNGKDWPSGKFRTVTPTTERKKGKQAFFFIKLIDKQED